MKLLAFIFLLSLSGYAPAQSIDSVKKTKWINYNRTRGIRTPQAGRKFAEKIYVTDKKDTLRRVLTIDRISEDILWEISYLNGKKNGLAIRYYANGVIASINYYLNDKIWETISAADTSGKLLYPGSLHDGNGTQIEYDYGINSTWLTTYRNGLPEGLFYVVHNGDTSYGNLTYKQSVVNYVPAQKCTYIDEKADTATAFFYEDEFNVFFKDSSTTGFWTLLKSSADSLPERSNGFMHLDNISFDDPAIIPTGKWIMQMGTVFKTIIHDNAGNAIRDFYTDATGKIIKDRTYPPCNKRKVVMRNADGSYRDEICK